MMWWIKHPERLAVELEAIEGLQANEPWLVRIREVLPGGLVFAVEFDINVNSQVLPFVLKYPSLFPNTPPSVFPRDGRRLPVTNTARAAKCVSNTVPTTGTPP